MLLNGEQIKKQETIPVYSPYSGQIVGEVSKCGPEDVPAVLAAAAEGFRQMRRLSTGSRAEILEKAAARIVDCKEEFARLLASEVGKTIQEARIEVTRAAGVLKMSAGAARQLCGETVPMDLTGDNKKLGFYQRVPLDCPGHYPLQLSAIPDLP